MAWCDGIADKAPGKLVKTTDGARAFLPDPLPRGLELTADLHRLVATARSRLGFLEGIGSLSTNPMFFVRSLQTREAAASSRIEGTKTTNEEALAHQVAHVETAHESDAKEVSNYLRALQQGVSAISKGRRLNRGLLLELHQTLLAGVRGQATQPGRLRDVQNFVGVSESIHEARFVPPPAIHVQDCIETLQKYLDEGSADDPIVRAALVHYQFETIHPFEDGNGRIGRLLVAVQTIQEGLQQQPLLYVSSRLEANRQEYYDRMLAVSLKGDFLGWVEFFVRAMIGAAEETTDKIRRLVGKMREFRAKLASSNSPGPARLLEKLEEYPFITVQRAQAFLKNSAGSTADAIAALEECGILARGKFKIQSKGRGRPPILYYCPEILKILR